MLQAMWLWASLVAVGKLYTTGELYVAGELYIAGEPCGIGRAVRQWASCVAVGKLGCSLASNTGPNPCQGHNFLTHSRMGKSCFFPIVKSGGESHGLLFADTVIL